MADIELMKIKREDADLACSDKYDVQKILDEESLHENDVKIVISGT